MLIKFVSQAILTYVMSYFMLPTGLCDHIRRMISQFWWGSIRGKGRFIGSVGISHARQKQEEA